MNAEGAARRWRGRLASARALGWSDRLRVLGLIGPLAATSLALRLWPLRSVRSGLRRVPARRSCPTADDTPTRLAALIHLASASLPIGGNCLHRSVLLAWMLERRGQAPLLCLGARRDPATGRPDFHAWVELRGMVINDRPDIRCFYTVLEPVADGVAPVTRPVPDEVRTVSSREATSPGSRSKPEG